MSVNADFHSDFMLNYGNLLPPMLADDIRIMIYIGMQARLRPTSVLGSLRGHGTLPSVQQACWLLPHNTAASLRVAAACLHLRSSRTPLNIKVISLRPPLQQ